MALQENVKELSRELIVDLSELNMARVKLITLAVTHGYLRSSLLLNRYHSIMNESLLDLKGWAYPYRHIETRRTFAKAI